MHASCWHQPCADVRISVLTSPKVPSSLRPIPSDLAYRPRPCRMNASVSSSEKNLWNKITGGSTEMRSGCSSANSLITRSNVACITPGGSAAVWFAGVGQRAAYCRLPRSSLAQLWLQLMSMKPGLDLHCPLPAHARHSAGFSHESGGPRS